MNAGTGVDAGPADGTGTVAVTAGGIPNPGAALIPLGSPDAAVCEGDVCVVPALTDVNRRLDADEV